MANKLREMVSGDRRRLKDDETNLDLSYITDSIIAMSFPASGFIERAWRNSMDEVEKFLENRHGGDGFMVWNLSERKYSAKCFQSKMIYAPFQDHHPPPFVKFFDIVTMIDGWLNDPRHIAVVHCIGGKGRTGTIISALLFFSGQKDTVEEAAAHFAQQRSEVGRGVTQPSQNRYLGYFEKFLLGQSLNLKPLLLEKIVLVGLDLTRHVTFEVYDSPFEGKLIYSKTPSPKTENKKGTLMFKIDTQVYGDLYIRARQNNPFGADVQIFRCCLHTYFISANSVVLDADELDHGEEEIDESFKMALTFKHVPPDGPCPNPDPILFAAWDTFKQTREKIQGTKSGASIMVDHTGADLPARPVKPLPMPKNLILALEKAAEECDDDEEAGEDLYFPSKPLSASTPAKRTKDQIFNNPAKDFPRTVDKDKDRDRSQSARAGAPNRIIPRERAATVQGYSSPLRESRDSGEVQHSNAVRGVPTLQRRPTKWESPRNREDKIKETYLELFFEADTDGDGKINFQDFSAFFGKTGQTAQALTSLWEQVNPGDARFLTYDQFSQCCQLSAAAHQNHNFLNPQKAAEDAPKMEPARALLGRSRSSPRESGVKEKPEEDEVAPPPLGGSTKPAGFGFRRADHPMPRLNPGEHTKPPGLGGSRTFEPAISQPSRDRTPATAGGGDDGPPTRAVGRTTFEPLLKQSRGGKQLPVLPMTKLNSMKTLDYQNPNTTQKPDSPVSPPLQDSPGGRLTGSASPPSEPEDLIPDPIPVETPVQRAATSRLRPALLRPSLMRAETMGAPGTRSKREPPPGWSSRSDRSSPRSETETQTTQTSPRSTLGPEGFGGATTPSPQSPPTTQRTSPRADSPKPPFKFETIRSKDQILTDLRQNRNPKTVGSPSGNRSDLTGSDSPRVINGFPPSSTTSQHQQFIESAPTTPTGRTFPPTSPKQTITGQPRVPTADPVVLELQPQQQKNSPPPDITLSPSDYDTLLLQDLDDLKLPPIQILHSQPPPISPTKTMSLGYDNLDPMDEPLAFVDDMTEFEYQQFDLPPGFEIAPHTNSSLFEQDLLSVDSYIHIENMDTVDTV